MQELVRLLRTLYLISKNSEKHEVVIDEDTLKAMLDTFKKKKKEIKEELKTDTKNRDIAQVIYLIRGEGLAKDEMLKQKEYAIEADCMYDREHFEWVTTRWQCGCCHAEVQCMDTECPHCRSKLRRKDENH